ncbi:4Fe-4S dicluster domain-containing protein [Halothermothrix orenii]|uniref:3-methyl-2-oxobutanoate dehydrogenase (Ferredoxin), delta subunit n=1 Tax=Halothermothrix orenii (strain H 168 / OCM 544 / DSM 9562) TaxID=373903 RepID=B8CVW5_HALOH|nr:4Fe-4S binding protein [Halothermothrix orenii]ACL69434.1 3-methyl-2-oxobutanoate dehydrogenase (ferredoxin), delta subunit [Halothermothrix orenii H 168]
MEQTKKVIFDEERCKGCELCTAVCPVKIIKMADRINSHGYHPAEVVDQDKCLSCGLCAQMCPDVVITVYK